MSKNKETLLLIDSHAIIHRAYHAFPPTLTTRDGQQINAVYGFTAILLEVLKQFDPKYLVCTFDSKGPTKRHEMYKEYKGTRKEIDPELVEQFPLVHKVVETFNIPILMKQGYEADDIIGTLAKIPLSPPFQKGEIEKELEIIIVTGDQDLLQLVDDRVKVYIQGSKFNGPKLYTPEMVEEKFGFGPDYVIDYKALRGDPSDNIPGVKGIGDKGAKQLIGDFGHLNEIYEHIEEVTSKSVKKKLEEQREQAELSRVLATIMLDAPVSFKLEDAVFKDFDIEKVKELFVEFSFKSLLKRIPEAEDSNSKSEILNSKHDANSKIQTTNNSQLSTNSAQVSMFGGPFDSAQGPVKGTNEIVDKSVKYKNITTEKEFDGFLDELEKQDIFAFDCETTGLDVMTVDVLGISFSWEIGEGYYVDFSKLEIRNSKLETLKRVFENPNVKKIGHNLKYDAHVIRNKTIKGDELGIEMTNYYFDTLVGKYVLSGGGKGLGLKNLAFNELGVVMTELDEVWQKIPGFKAKKKYSKEEVTEYMINCDKDLLGYYACADADITWQLFKLQNSKFEEVNSKLKELFFDIEMPLVRILLEMEREGIKLDEKYLKKLGEEVNEKIQTIKLEIYEFIGHEFNLDSPKQVGEILFDELKFPGGKKTKTGAWQTNERILRNFVEPNADISNEQREFVKKILEFRELSKIRSTYIDSLIQELNANTKHIHTSYNQTVASTGRLTSSSPNLQNIPVSSKVGNKIRKSFVSDEDTVFLAFDISQQELRILAHVSGEKSLIEAFENDIDIHTLTASRIFDKEIDEITKKERSTGKTLNFSLIYGISAFGLADRLKVGREEAQELIDNYFKVYPKVKEYFDNLLESSKETGKVETMFGRYRETSGLINSNFRIRAAAEREVINFPIQGTAADMIKISMDKCMKYLETSKVAKDLDAKMILQIHDELVFKVQELGSGSQEKKEKFIKDIMKIMQNAVELIVPVKVDYVEGRSWDMLK